MTYLSAVYGVHGSDRLLQTWNWSEVDVIWLRHLDTDVPQAAMPSLPLGQPMGESMEVYFHNHMILGCFPCRARTACAAQISRSPFDEYDE